MKKSAPRLRIVLTGGPGGGKTTAADLFRREIGNRVVIVPEAATILFQGGFPRCRKPDPRRIVQTAIFPGPLFRWAVVLSARGRGCFCNAARKPSR